MCVCSTFHFTRHIKYCKSGQHTFHGIKIVLKKCKKAIRFWCYHISRYKKHRHMYGKWNELQSWWTFVIYIIYITTHVHFQWSISQDLVFNECKCSSCALVAHMRHITKGMSRFVGSCLVLSCLLLSYLVLFVRDH